MSLHEFLEQITLSDRSLSQVMAFYSVDSYPLFLISLIHTTLEKKVKKKYVYIDCQETEVDLIIRLLQTAVLGKAAWYWLGNLSELSVLKRKKIEAVLKDYNGPHYITYFLYEKEVDTLEKSICFVELPDKIHKDNITLFNKLDFFQYNKSYIAIKNFLCKEFVQVKVDSMLLSFYYLMFLGRKRKIACKKQLLSIILPEHSLFIFSGYFFAKKAKLFFNEWLKIKDSYSDHFWTVFWSEQLWRAYFYIQYMQHNDKQASKKICYRLPFSFINYDWKKHSLASLFQAHEAIMDLDLNIKNGSQSLEEIELFYTEFFL